MESSSERMPIACVHCAKAKAKCDKKVPCSRCVGKQIVCQSRATRRSSQNPSRRSNLSRSNSDRPLHTSSGYPVPQLAQYAASAPHDAPLVSPTSNVGSVGPSHHSMPDLTIPVHSIQVASNMLATDLDSQMLRNNFGHTPPEMNFPITPMMSNMPHMDVFLPMNGTHFDPDVEGHFLSLGNAHNGMIEFEAANLLNDFMSPHSMIQDSSDHYFMSHKGNGQTPNHMSISMPGSAPLTSRIGLDLDKSPQHALFSAHLGSSSSSVSVSSSSGLQEPDAVIASHQAWPFFQCNAVEKYSFVPPKTANIYLEGLAQTLRSRSTWHAWSARIKGDSLDVATERKISTEPIIGWSREKLLAITQGFLHKALDIHKVAQNAGDASPSGPDMSRETFLMLPPPEVMQYFLQSYVVRYEPYYSSVPGGRLDPNALMLSSNSKAASLLVLLMLASGATATAAVEARYIASGLTEACRISLFDTVEKDISQARETLVLRSALLFTCLAAWSGDKWHMDMAMGQRGMYLAMLAHAGMLESSESHLDINDCKLDAERAWEDWKEHEGKHRLAHSWVIVDQEMSLFSDTTPLLSVVDLHAPMPDLDDLWHADSAQAWLNLFEGIYGSTYRDPPSVRDFFTRFVDGDLTGHELSPIQLRLLLHPLQAQVCQLRQLIACLPDSGNHHKPSRAVSKAATKARLEEISSLLQQWYAISRQTSAANKQNCWTTCANLIMYHLISLNGITSFKCIEQFARKEINLSPARYATWLRMRCIDQPEEAYFHCGQILRLIRTIPKPVRPPWWAGAVYRVALIAWATGTSRVDSRYDHSDRALGVGSQFVIDELTPEHELISRYMKYQEGTPMLSGLDGRPFSMLRPSNVVRHCIGILEADGDMRLTDGIKRKLKTFLEQWDNS